MAFLSKINLLAKNSIEDVEEFYFGFLGGLYKNGQISRDFQLINDGDTYSAYITIPEKNSLDISYMNAYSLLDLENLSFDVEIIGQIADVPECCHCTNITSYFLETSYMDSQSPMKCGICNKSIPLYKIPHILGEKEHFSIVQWAQDYYCIDKLWMSCLADRFTKRQLTDYHSQLFKNAIMIRKELQKVLKQPVYYVVYYPHKVPTVCPMCFSQWKESSENAYLVCDHCYIATAKH